MLESEVGSSFLFEHDPENRFPLFGIMLQRAAPQLMKAREMRHGKYPAIGAIVLAALTAQAIAAPKRLKHLPPKPLAGEPSPLPFVSTFITYDVGTLRMTGKTAADTTYTIGTLKLIGAAAAPVTFNVGTLSMTGKLKP